MCLYSLLFALLFGWKFAILFFISFPLCSYACIKILEEELHVWRSTIPLALNLIQKNYREICKEIKENRQILQKEIRDLIEKLGPKMGTDFWKERVISHDEIIEDENNVEDTKKSLFKYKRRIYHAREIDDSSNILTALEEIY